MTNIWHSLMKIRPHEPQRNGTPENRPQNLLLHCWCCVGIINSNRLATDGVGWQGTVRLPKIGQM